MYVRTSVDVLVELVAQANHRLHAFVSFCIFVLARKTRYVRIYVCSSSDPWHLVTAHPHMSVTMRNDDIFATAVLDVGSKSVVSYSADEIDSGKMSVDGEEQSEKTDTGRRPSVTSKLHTTPKGTRLGPKRTHLRPRLYSRKPCASGERALTPLDPCASSAQTGNLWQVVFVNAPVAQPSQSTSNDVQYTAVCIWPQYTINRMDGTYVVVAKGEEWLDRIFHTLKGRSSPNNPADPMRALQRKFFKAMNHMLKEGLSGIRGEQRIVKDPGEDSDEDEGPLKRSDRFLSGFDPNHVPTVRAKIADITVTLVNCSRVIILKVDEAGINFISTVIVDVVRILTKPTDNNPIQDIPNKVVWLTNENAWQVMAKVDNQEQKTIIEVHRHDITPKWDDARRAAHAKAIDLWNLLDNSGRRKIRAPSGITRR